MKKPTKNKVGKLELPAIISKMGNREYILCAFPVGEFCKRVDLAVNIYGRPEDPSDYLQRDEKASRVKDIVEYLKTDHRFFNAMVVAMCSNNTNWQKFKRHDASSSNRNDNHNFGLLSLSGEEDFYVLDGQHRMRGIKAYLESNDISDEKKKNLHQDFVSAVIVHHDHIRPSGMKHSRRLFTVLNKHAERVSKRDIIYMDEDSAMALVARELIEGKDSYNKTFQRNVRISESSNNQFHPTEEAKCFTTVGALYDCLEILFINILSDTIKNAVGKKQGKKSLENLNPPDDLVKKLASEVFTFFALLIDNVKDLKKYYTEQDEEKLKKIVGNLRTTSNKKAQKDHLLFRPMGLKAFINIVCDYHEQKNNSMEECIKMCSKLPMYMDDGDGPMVDLVWDSTERKIIKESATKRFKLLENIYRDMLGLKLKLQKSDPKTLEENWEKYVPSKPYKKHSLK